jgi:hypothetical protein
MEAAENNHLDAVKYLIKAGAQVDPKVLPLSPPHQVHFLILCVGVSQKDEPGHSSSLEHLRSW